MHICIQVKRSAIEEMRALTTKVFNSITIGKGTIAKKACKPRSKVVQMSVFLSDE